MKRLASAGGVAFLVAAGLVTASVAGRVDDPPSIKDVMQKLHKGAKSPLAQIKGQLKSQSPDWKVIQDNSKDFVILGAALSKNDPPKGDKENWKTQADAYFTNSKAMDDAAQKEDKAATQAAFGKVEGSCKACHVAHKGK